jgi:hypothetical protein
VFSGGERKDWDRIFFLIKRGGRNRERERERKREKSQMNVQ